MPADSPACFEDGTFCNFTDGAFDAMLQPIIFIFGVLTYPIIYGIFVGIIWLKTKDPMMAGIVGLLMAGAGITSGAIDGWNIEVIQMAVLLLAISIGVVFYQLFISKVQNPTQ